MSLTIDLGINVSADTNPAALYKRNLLRYSQDFTNATWRSGVPGGTVIANTADTTAPDGTSTATKASATAVSFGGIFARSNAYTYLSNTTYTFSVYAKAGTTSYVGLRSSGGSASGTDLYCYYNLSTGSATSITPASGTVVLVNSTNAGNGWWRCRLTYTTGASIPSSITDIAITSSTGATAVTPSSTSNIYVWGAQLELGANMSDYIATQ